METELPVGDAAATLSRELPQASSFLLLLLERAPLESGLKNLKLLYSLTLSSQSLFLRLINAFMVCESALSFSFFLFSSSCLPCGTGLVW